MLRPASVLAALLCVQQPIARSYAAERAATPLHESEERGLKAGDHFRECDACPEMAVIPAGSFTMGSLDHEPGRSVHERRLEIAIPRPFAVGTFAVTFQ